MLNLHLDGGGGRGVGVSPLTPVGRAVCHRRCAVLGHFLLVVLLLLLVLADCCGGHPELPVRCPRCGWAGPGRPEYPAWAGPRHSQLQRTAHRVWPTNRQVRFKPGCNLRCVRCHLIPWLCFRLPPSPCPLPLPTPSPPCSSFAGINPALAPALASVYASVNDVDSWIGGLAETHQRGSSLGPLFTKVRKAAAHHRRCFVCPLFLRVRYPPRQSLPPPPHPTCTADPG